MASQLRIGMIGLDTSHAVEFTELLNNKNHPWHISGGSVTIAYPGGSDDFPLSKDRVDGFTAQLRDQYDVRIAASPEMVAEQSDVILLEAVDGRTHLELFRSIAPYGKPVFIDKPFTISAKEANEIYRLSRIHHVKFMSCSAVRYAPSLTAAIHAISKEAVIGADCYGPMDLQQTQPGLFWYGVHMADMLYAAMGQGCQQVTAASTEDHDVIVGEWSDGRIGTIRGNRKGNRTFGALIHSQTNSIYANVNADAKPYYAALLEAVMLMFTGGAPGTDPLETVEIVRFMEAANESRQTGLTVKL